MLESEYSRLCCRIYPIPWLQRCKAHQDALAKDDEEHPGCEHGEMGRQEARAHDQPGACNEQAHEEPLHLCMHRISQMSTTIQRDLTCAQGTECTLYLLISSVPLPRTQQAYLFQLVQRMLLLVCCAEHHPSDKGAQLR